jgi:hypothetical protein
MAEHQVVALEVPVRLRPVTRYGRVHVRSTDVRNRTFHSSRRRSSRCSNRESLLVQGKRPRTNLKEMAIMSGCYDDNDYDYCGSDYSYDECYKPRHHRPRRHHNSCWDYSPTYCD